VETLLAGASDREPILSGAGKSGARLERVVIDGQRYVVKYLHLADDWTMRAAGDLSGAASPPGGGAFWRDCRTASTSRSSVYVGTRAGPPC